MRRVAAVPALSPSSTLCLSVRRGLFVGRRYRHCVMESVRPYVIASIHLDRQQQFHPSEFAREADRGRARRRSFSSRDRRRSRSSSSHRVRRPTPFYRLKEKSLPLSISSSRWRLGTNRRFGRPPSAPWLRRSLDEQLDAAGGRRIAASPRRGHRRRIRRRRGGHTLPVVSGQGEMVAASGLQGIDSLPLSERRAKWSFLMI